MRWLGIGVAAALLVAPAAAPAQHVLVCFTLHNDLSNFDRRAHSVDYYSRSVFEAALAAYKRAYQDYQSACLPSGEPTYVGPDCEALNREAVRHEAEYYRLQWLNSDPIRRRIIAEMISNRCPVDPPPPP
jgi:hypothetical protein